MGEAETSREHFYTQRVECFHFFLRSFRRSYMLVSRISGSGEAFCVRGASEELSRRASVRNGATARPAKTALSARKHSKQGVQSIHLTVAPNCNSLVPLYRI